MLKQLRILYAFLFVLTSCAKCQTFKVLAVQKEDVAFAHGDVYSKSSWASTTDFVANGGSVSLSGDKLLVSGGTSQTDFTKSVDYNYSSGVEQFTITTQVKVQDITATTYGIGPGLRSMASYGSPLSLATKLNLTTDANAGKLTIHTTINGGSLVQAAASAQVLSFAINDIIELTFTLQGGTATATAKNLTTGGPSVFASYTYSLTTAGTTGHLPNNGRYALFSYGGSYEVQSFAVRINAYRNATFMLIGDSKTRGYNATTFPNRYYELLRVDFPNIGLDAGGNDRTTEVINQLPEIIAMHPQKVVLNIGSNDKRSGVTFAAWAANYDYITATLEAAGIPVYHLLQFNETILTFSDYNNHITATFPSGKIINAGTIALSSDGVHPSDAGHVQIYNAVKAAMQ